MKKNILLTILYFMGTLQTINIMCTEIKERNKNVYFIILAGGNGTRLWPLSRQAKPKQFIAVGNKKTLLDQAIDRVSLLVPKENIWISTTKEHEANIKRYVGNKIGNIIVEPGLRNTGPAILLGCMTLYKHNPNASVIFLPSDPFISEAEIFIDYLKQAIDFTIKHNHITLLGLKPTYPATGYGYIEFNKQAKTAAPYKVIKFHEKPELEKAKQYITKDTMLWNSGMFCGKAVVFIQEFKKEAPEIFEGVLHYVNGTGKYNDVKSDSIDYAIMEKSNNIYVLPVDFPWCDVGNIEIFLKIQKEYKQLDNNIISVDSKNNLIKVKDKDKLITLIGVNDLCIVDTNDILLITKNNKAEQVRTIVSQLKESNKTQYL